MERQIDVMKLLCPESSCRAENDALARECVGCEMPLQNYIQLLNYPARLFNLGLAKARNGALEQARDLFAAVVYWCPKDLEARNALAMACLALHDLVEAAGQWKIVLAQSPTDPLALRGLREIEAEPWRGDSPAQPKTPSVVAVAGDRQGDEPATVKRFFRKKRKKQ
jgi:tetratricopeptide (TPR) repeat protein